MAVLRSAGIEDYEFILLLKLDVHMKHVKAEPKFYKSSEDILPRSVYEDELKKNHIFVLEDKEYIIGYVFTTEITVKDHPLIQDQRILLLEDVCIDEKCRNKGYGSELMRKMFDYAKDHGYSSIELNVWEFNEEARSFYKKAGMRNTRIRMIKEF